MRFVISRLFRLVSQIISEFITINFYNFFTPTCTSSFYPDDHLGRFMGFSRFVELKSARFVERLRKIKKDIIRDIVDEKIFINWGGTLLLLRAFDYLFSLSPYYDASLKTLFRKNPLILGKNHEVGKRVHQGVEFAFNYSTFSCYKHATTLVTRCHLDRSPYNNLFLRPR